MLLCTRSHLRRAISEKSNGSEREPAWKRIAFGFPFLLPKAQADPHPRLV